MFCAHSRSAPGTGVGSQPIDAANTSSRLEAGSVLTTSTTPSLIGECQRTCRGDGRLADASLAREEHEPRRPAPLQRRKHSLIFHAVRLIVGDVPARWGSWKRGGDRNHLTAGEDKGLSHPTPRDAMRAEDRRSDFPHRLCGNSPPPAGAPWNANRCGKRERLSSALIASASASDGTSPCPSPAKSFDRRLARGSREKRGGDRNHLTAGEGQGLVPSDAEERDARRGQTFRLSAPVVPATPRCAPAGGGGSSCT